MAKFTLTGKAGELRESERFCTCCSKPLTGRVIWLERNCSTGTYHNPGDVPSLQSQGEFPFGVRCASRKLQALRVDAPVSVKTGVA